LTAKSKDFYVYAFLRFRDSIRGSKYSPYYIGKGRGKRAFERHGRTVPAPGERSCIAFVQEGLTESEALSLETYCIQLYGRIDIGTGILHNRTNGGEGTSGLVVSAETKRKMSELRRGEKHPNWGKTPSRETRQRMSDAKRGEKHPNWGKTRPPEVCDKISKGQKGRVQSKETRRKLSLAKAIYLYELIDSGGEVYVTDHLFCFAQQHGLDNGALNRVVHGIASHHKGWTGRIIERLK
jgi:hypothetical protein